MFASRSRLLFSARPLAPLVRAPLATLASRSSPALSPAATLARRSPAREPLLRRALCSSGGGSGAGGAGGAGAADNGWTRFWAWTTQTRPSWKENAVEAAVAFTVFGVTGSTSVAVVRPALKSTIGLEGSLKEGPWSYRVLSILLVSPIYATFLVFFGTVAGRHRFFANMAGKIFNRFLPTAVSSRIARAFGWCFPLAKGGAKGA